MGKHAEGNAPGTEAQKAAKKAVDPKHGSGKSAKDTGYVGRRRAVDGTETDR